MRLAVCNKTLNDRPVEAFFALAGDAGFDAVEVIPGSLGTPIADPDPAMRVQILQVARAMGLEFVAMNSIFEHVPTFNLVTDDSDLRQRSAEELVAIVHLGAHMGVTSIVIGSPRQRRAPANASFDEATDLFIDGLIPAATVAQEFGITLCLEPLIPSLTNFMNDTTEGITVARRMNHPAVKLVLDVKQIARETQNFKSAVEIALPWLAHVHVNDANMQAPGEGDTDFLPIIKSLKEVGYGGVISIEAFTFADDPKLVLTRSRRHLESILDAS